MKKILKTIFISIGVLFIITVGFTFYLSRGVDSYGTIEITNQIFERVINEQKLTVDTMAGTIVTSKAYLKSIENALK